MTHSRSHHPRHAKGDKAIWVRFVAPCTICAHNRMAGDIARVSRAIASELIRDARAVLYCRAPSIRKRRAH